MGFTEDDLGKTFEKTKSKKTEKLDTTKYLNYFQFSCFRFFSVTTQHPYRKLLVNKA